MCRGVCIFLIDNREGFSGIEGSPASKRLGSVMFGVLAHEFRIGKENKGIYLRASTRAKAQVARAERMISERIRPSRVSQPKDEASAKASQRSEIRPIGEKHFGISQYRFPIGLRQILPRKSRVGTVAFVL